MIRIANALDTMNWLVDSEGVHAGEALGATARFWGLDSYEVTLLERAFLGGW